MSNKKEEGFISSLLGVLLVVWIFWMVYCWVMPQVWPSAPAQVLHPGFWLTYAIVILLRFVRKFVFGIK